MRQPDFREVLDQLRRESHETHAEIVGLIARLHDTPPRTVRELHDAKAELMYLTLALRAVKKRAASYAAEDLSPDPAVPGDYRTSSR